MANLSPANEARLRAALGERGLQAAEEEIVASSVECATLLVTVPEDYATVGTSRYGGVPDLPDEKLWPQTADGKFYQFFMQVNLADVPDFAGNVLPRRGMLYAFLADYNNVSRHWSVLWADVSPVDLRRMEAKPAEQIAGWNEKASILSPYLITVQTGVDVPRWYSQPYNMIEQKVIDSMDETSDEDDNFDTFDEVYRDFSLTARNLVETQNWIAKLLGHPFYIGYDPNEDGGDGMEIPDGFVLLISFFSQRIVNVSFGDAGYVQVFINGDALANQDFSYVFARMESS